MSEIAKTSNGLYETCIEIMKRADVDPKDPVKTIAWICENKTAPTTQKNYLCSVQYWLRESPDAETARAEYRKKIKELADVILERYKDQELTEKEAKNFLEWKVIQKYAEEILKDVGLVDMDKLLVAFYTLLPPVRLDYCNLALYDEKPTEDKGNYVVINDTEAYVRINEHKTAKKYGALQNKLPKRLVRRIRVFMELYPDQKVLFPMSEKTLARKLARIFRRYTDKDVGVCLLRHSYISHFLEGAPGLRECDALARQMGHSATLQQYYRRLRRGEVSTTESDTESDEE